MIYIFFRIRKIIKLIVIFSFYLFISRTINDTK